MFPHIFTWQMKSSVLMIQKHHATSLLSRFEDLWSTGHSNFVIFFASASPRFFYGGLCVPHLWVGLLCSHNSNFRVSVNTSANLLCHQCAYNVLVASMISICMHHRRVCHFLFAPIFICIHFFSTTGRFSLLFL